MSIFFRFKKFTIFFVIIFILNIVFLYVLTDYKIVAKPMIMATLIGLYISVEQKQSNTFILALIFALLGDAFLLFQSEDFFLIGLGCFLIMQLLYTGNFLLDSSQNIKRLLSITAVVGILNVGALSVMWNDLGNLKMPVIIYSLAISAMVISAFVRRKEIRGYLNVLLGVVFFLISDAILGISKFGSPFLGHDVIVISTYIIAQYLIVTGIILKNEN